MTLSFKHLASLAVLMTGLASTSLALAHPTLVRSIPAADASAPPLAKIQLEFNERILPRATRVDLTMIHNGMRMAMPATDQKVSDEGHSLQVSFAKPLPRGNYQLEWRAVGQDSHPMTGSYRFTIR